MITVLVWRVQRAYSHVERRQTPARFLHASLTNCSESEFLEFIGIRRDLSARNTQQSPHIDRDSRIRVLKNRKYSSRACGNGVLGIRKIRRRFRNAVGTNNWELVTRRTSARLRDDRTRKLRMTRGNTERHSGTGGPTQDHWLVQVENAAKFSDIIGKFKKRLELVVVRALTETTHIHCNNTKIFKYGLTE